MSAHMTDHADKRGYLEGSRARRFARWLTAPQTWAGWQLVAGAAVYALVLVALDWLARGN